jgi:hypothetical protein
MTMTMTMTMTMMIAALMMMIAALMKNVLSNGLDLSYIVDDDDEEYPHETKHRYASCAGTMTTTKMTMETLNMIESIVERVLTFSKRIL